MTKVKVGNGAAHEQEAEAGASEQEAETTEESAGADGRQEGQRAHKSSPREVEPLDLGSVSRGALVKRAGPVLAGLAGLGLFTLLIRFLMRPSLSVKFEVRKN